MSKNSANISKILKFLRKTAIKPLNAYGFVEQVEKVESLKLISSFLRFFDFLEYLLNKYQGISSQIDKLVKRLLFKAKKLILKLKIID